MKVIAPGTKVTVKSFKGEVQETYDDDTKLGGEGFVWVMDEAGYTHAIWTDDTDILIVDEVLEQDAVYKDAVGDFFLYSQYGHGWYGIGLSVMLPFDEPTRPLTKMSD